MMHRLTVAIGSVLVVMVAIIAVINLKTDNTNAITGADWRAGHIIDDALFYDSSTMSTGEIQNFLNSKVSNCDTNGTQIYSGSTTNAQYAASQGWPGPPYVCLKDYYQVPRSDQNINNLSTNSIPSGAISAAEIIKRAADSFGISPKVLLVTLEKESLNLIKDNWPLPNQYRNPMGYGCPDTAPCDPQYEGFYNQVHNAARQFKLYKDNPNNYRYKPFQINSILYNVANTGCPASDVYIDNYATAGLYNYTPYQPNQAALDNLYGSGDACSAYGNRNFWRIYTDWFGPTDGTLTIAHPDGTLIRAVNSNKVYITVNGKAQAIPTIAIAQSWGYDLGKVKIASQDDVILINNSEADTSHSTTPAPMKLREGAIIKGTSPNIYVVKYVNGEPTKVAFASWEAFAGLGYTMNDVINVPDDELPLTTGASIANAATIHPDGALVRSANSPTVYLLINGERHALPSISIFTSHGHKMSMVKIANAADEASVISWPVTWISEGTLVRGNSGPTVYIVDVDVTGVNACRRPIYTLAIFNGLRYRFSEVMVVNDNEVPVATCSPVGS